MFVTHDEYTIREKNGVYWVDFCTRSISPEMILRALAEELVVLGQQPYRDVWDFRSCMPCENFGFETLMSIRDKVSAGERQLPGLRTAVLVDEGVGYGFGRMYEELAAGLNVTVKAFTSENDALAWLMIP